MSTPARSPRTGPSPTGPAPFAGYPYLVTRIGHSTLRHMAILPAGWPRYRLLDLARRQAQANQFGTCVCFGPADAVFVSPDGDLEPSSVIPTGIPVVEKLALAEPIPATPDVLARRAALEAYAEQANPGGYIVGDGLEGGRLASAADLERLRPSDDPAAIPPGLARCDRCGDLAGDYLALRGEGNGDRRPRVIRVHCRCENDTRCGGCGQPLAERRLSAYEYSESECGVRYWAAYMAFSHRCTVGV